MKKLLGVLVIILLWCESSIAISQDSLIKQYLSGRKLDLIEGVWADSGGNVRLYAKSGNGYESITIRHHKRVIGQRGGYLTKGSNSYYYGNGFAYYGEGGKRCNLTVTVNLTEGRWQCNEVNTSLYRLWPSNIVAYNSTFEKPKQKKKPKKDPNDNKVVPAGSGSGFFVLKNGTLITNYHVIEGCELNKVHFKGESFDSKVLSVDKVNDIAILKTDIIPAKVFSVSNEDVSLLEDVVVAGYPLGKQISAAIKTHKGVVTSLAGAGDNYSFFQTDAAINQGNSGGPIIDQKGNVVGIAVATWVEEGVQGVHFGIKSSTLKTFASSNGLKFIPPNTEDFSNKELGQLITEGTVYVECHMTIAKIKEMIAETENKKAFFSEYQ